ncbi:hypothetical protein PMAYCL1PPCAC_02454, partial [Pristionchus mayeri]
LQKTAARVPQTELLSLTYIDILKEEWAKMKAPEDDNVEEALLFYRDAYRKGKDLWMPFGPHTATILAHVSALHEINLRYPHDILDLTSPSLDFSKERFLRVIEKADRLVLPESFLVESVYRTDDKNMGLLAFRIAQVMLRRAFQSGTDLVKHMQDDIEKCTTLQFRETYFNIYNKKHTSRKNAEDIYFMVVNGAARFFNPFTEAFECKEGDKLHFVESNCLPLGSSNIQRRSSYDL